MVELLKKFMKDEEGQDLVEYALLLVFLALAAIAVLPTLGSAVNNVFSQSASTLTAVPNPSSIRSPQKSSEWFFTGLFFCFLKDNDFVISLIYFADSSIESRHEVR